jgi:pyruvate formate lyase activating enzyme
MKRSAMFYEKLDNNFVHCYLCPHNCHIKDSGIGFCGVRKNEEGELYSLNYGEITSAALDPIEKKPIALYRPGSYILSVGSFGCNMTCGFCQNHSISREKAPSSFVEPKDLINLAMKSKVEDGNIGIAFTYNEPSIWYEYVYDVCQQADLNELDMVLVSNGYISPEPLKEILPYISAMNIDLKAFNDEYYKKTCSGDVESVKKTIEIASPECNVEVTTLLVNGYNDSPEEVEKLCQWLASVNPEIPLHLSRYFPRYKFDAPATPVETLYTSKEIADNYLHHVFLGNI